MSRHLHLVNRNGVFYWRRRLPNEIARAFGRRQIVISVRCRDPRTAGRIARSLTVLFDRFLYRMQLEKRTPTKDEQRLVLKQLYRLIIEACQEERAYYFPLTELPPDAVLVHQNGPQVSDPVAPEVRDRQAFFRDPALSAELMRDHSLAHRLAPIRCLLKPVLEERHIDVANEDIAFRKFLRDALQLAARAFEDADGEINGTKTPIGLDDLIAEARDGETSVAQALPQSRPAASATPARLEAPASHPESAGVKPFSAFIDEFIGEKKKGRTEGTKNQVRVALNLMVRILGDRPAGSLTRADGKRLHAVLESLPSTTGKSEHHQSMTIDEIIAAKSPGDATMSRATLDRHWRYIVEFSRWLNVQDDVPPIDVDRVFGGFEWSEHVPEGEETRLWDDDSIERLFKSPIWTGFTPHPKKRYWRHEPGNVVLKDAYWWLPLLGFYHGAREEEFCRLRGTDIYQEKEDGIFVMHFHGSHLKTPSSRREVPIHSAIIKLGLLELAKSAGEDLLFPYLREGGRDRKLTYEYSQHFTDYRRRIGVYQKMMHFHSTRHQVTTQVIADSKVTAEGGSSILMADEITGHDSKLRKEIKETQSESLRYFKGHKARSLKEAIESINYPQIDIDRLAALAANSELHAARLAKRFPLVWGNQPALRARPARSGRRAAGSNA